MKQKLLRYAILVFLIWGTGAVETTLSQSKSDATDALLKFQDEIKTDYLRPHLTILASDSMEGRETGMPGQKMAARYLVEQYRKMGLKPADDDNTYLQKFNLEATVSDSTVFETYKEEEEGRITIDRSVSSKSGVGRYIHSFGGTDTLDGQIVFAGFGVSDTLRGVNHLKRLDLKGKWVMVFQEIPNIVDGDTLIDPAETNRSRFASIITEGKAEGIILIPSVDSEVFQRESRQVTENYGKPSAMKLAYLQNGTQSRGFSKGYNVIDPTLAAKIIGLEEEGELPAFRDSVIDNITEFTPKITDIRLKHTPHLKRVNIETENVAALLEGGDPQLKDEVVVLTSHYDHVGVGTPDSTGDSIYNGADDDGSGTVALLNIAKAYVAAGQEGITPRRSILFLHVSGEEKGLLGSRYYSDHPLIPIEKTIANINTDMIGRIDKEHAQEGVENYSYIIGGKIISSQLDTLIRVANRRSGEIRLSDRYNDLNDPNQFYRRSDHWNFGRLGVPFVFFFTGVHEDYHRPGDEIHKIRFEKMTKITRTIYASSVLLANTEHLPEVDNQMFIRRTQEN